jgi:hypothetical protein
MLWTLSGLVPWNRRLGTPSRPPTALGVQVVTMVRASGSTTDLGPAPTLGPEFSSAASVPIVALALRSPIGVGSAHLDRRPLGPYFWRLVSHDLSADSLVVPGCPARARFAVLVSRLRHPQDVVLPLIRFL